MYAIAAVITIIVIAGALLPSYTCMNDSRTQCFFSMHVAKGGGRLHLSMLCSVCQRKFAEVLCTNRICS